MTKLVTVLFVILVVGGFLFFKFHAVLGVKSFPFTSHSVKGASTSIFSPQVQSTIGQLQQQVAHLSAKDISSSSPQVQGILRTLQQLPAGEAHDICQKLCGSYLK